jgi:hypothetical protein
MARKSLKPQLNQIRAWVRQGRTDAWIAHQLEVSASELREFRKQQGFTPDEEGTGGEVDLRDEIEAEIEAATAEEAEEAETEEAEEAETEEAEEGAAEEAEEGAAEGVEGAEEAGEGAAGEKGEERPRPRRRRRGRRGGRGRRKELEATFDHGETDGYGLWLDPSVKDNPVYAEHWAGRREVIVRIEADQIVIRRAGAGEDDESDD